MWLWRSVATGSNQCSIRCSRIQANGQPGWLTGSTELPGTVAVQHAGVWFAGACRAVLVNADAPGPVAAVDMTFRIVHEGQGTPGTAGQTTSRCNTGSAVGACRTGATCQTDDAGCRAALRACRRIRMMMKGAPVDDISDRFLDAISRLEAVADAVGPHDAYRQLDETSMQVFWRRWPGISSSAGSLWRLLNEELMDPTVSSHYPDADEVGGSG
jgi:hypothetical protein